MITDQQLIKALWGDSTRFVEFFDGTSWQYNNLPYTKFNRFCTFSEKLKQALMDHPVFRPIFSWNMALGRNGISLWAIKGITGIQDPRAAIEECVEKTLAIGLTFCSGTQLPIYFANIYYKDWGSLSTEVQKAMPFYEEWTALPKDRYGRGKWVQSPLHRAIYGGSRASLLDRSEVAIKREETLENSYPLSNFTREEDCRLFDPYNLGCDISQDAWDQMKRFTFSEVWNGSSKG